MNTTTTPETDAATFKILSSLQSGTEKVVHAEICAKLERERDEFAAKLTGNEAYQAGLLAERDEARDQLNAMREVIAAAEKCRHWHDCSYNEDTGKTEGVIISAESFWSLQTALAKLQPFLP